MRRRREAAQRVRDADAGADRPAADRRRAARRRRDRLARRLSRAGRATRWRRWSTPRRGPGSTPRPGRSAKAEAPRRGRRQPPSGCTTSTARRQPTRRGACCSLLMAMTAIGPTTLNILVPALPQLAQPARRRRRAPAAHGLALSCSALAVAQLVMGPLSDRFGRRPVLLAGLALTAAASLLAIVMSDRRQPDRGAHRCRRSAPRPASWSAAPSSATCSTATAPPR